MSTTYQGAAFYAILGVLAAQVDDLETMRIASANRYRTLATEDRDENDVVRGMNLGTDHPMSRQLNSVVLQMGETEKLAIRNLEKFIGNSMWGGFVKTHRGVGAKQLARLLAAIGDPYWHVVNNRPRTVSQLWAYSGMHTVPYTPDGKVATGDNASAYRGAPRRQRGIQSNWNESARKRAWLVIQSCIKSGDNAYREAYDLTREKYAEAVHTVPCVRCGPSGSPAAAGSELRDGHKHARAIRYAGKRLLRDLWRVSRDHHGGPPDPDPPLRAIAAAPAEVLQPV